MILTVIGLVIVMVMLKYRGTLIKVKKVTLKTMTILLGIIVLMKVAKTIMESEHVQQYEELQCFKKYGEMSAALM